MNLTTMTADAGMTASDVSEVAMGTLVERRRRRREALHERTRSTQNAHQSDEALWPGSVANPGRTRVR